MVAARLTLTGMSSLWDIWVYVRKMRPLGRTRSIQPGTSAFRPLGLRAPWESSWGLRNYRSGARIEASQRKGSRSVRGRFRAPLKPGRFLDRSGGPCASNPGLQRGCPFRIALRQACGAGQQGTTPPAAGARASRVSSDHRHYSLTATHGRADHFEPRTRPTCRLSLGLRFSTQDSGSHRVFKC